MDTGREKLGSLDNGAVMSQLEDLERQEPRLRVRVEERNGGASAARNNVLSTAHSQYVVSFCAVVEERMPCPMPLPWPGGRMSDRTNPLHTVSSPKRMMSEYGHVIWQPWTARVECCCKAGINKRSLLFCENALVGAALVSSSPRLSHKYQQAGSTT